MKQSILSSITARNDILANMIAVCPDGIIGVDRQGTVVIFNIKAALLTQRKCEDVLGCLDIGQIYGGREKAKQIKAILYSEDFGGTGRLDGFETVIVDINNTIIPIRLSAVLITENGKEIGSVGFFHDLTNQKNIEKRLSKLSITDGLTTLYNQRHFHFCLSDEIERAIRYHRPLSLICFDLDNFKGYNDRFGHLEGDNALRYVGNLLNVITRSTDRCFRYGGDEFFVILPETDLDNAMTVAKKSVLTFNESWPYEILESIGVSNVTLSIGVVQRINETSCEPLIKRADMAMYRAKNQGGNMVASGN